MRVLDAFGIAVVGVDGYEADDVIGTLATGAGMPVDVVTGDRDLFQLVDDEADVRVLYIARGVGRHERVTAEVVREKYGVEAHQYADFATLRGRQPPTGCPAWPGSARRPPRPCCSGSATCPASWPPPTTPTPTSGPTRGARSGPRPTTSPSRRRWWPSPATSTPTTTTRRSPASRATPSCWPRSPTEFNLGGPVERLAETLATR